MPYKNSYKNNVFFKGKIARVRHAKRKHHKNKPGRSNVSKN